MSLVTKPRSKIQHRKRQAQHHRHSKTYLKTYWPYLPMLSILGVALVINHLWLSQGSVLGGQTNFSRASLLQLTNSDRLASKEPALRINSQLNSAAQARAEDMVNNNYWSHTSPTGKTLWNFIISNGYQFQAAGENLAYGFSNVNGVESAWMNSPDHRLNILTINYMDVGFGIAQSANYLNQGPKVIIVAEYGEPLSAVSAASSVSPTLTTSQFQPVSRFQALVGTNAKWSELLITALASATVTIVIIRHGLYLRKFLRKSEVFVIEHPLFDITLVFIATVSVMLMHPFGLIG